MVFKLSGLNKLFYKGGATALPSREEVVEMELFYTMLLKMGNKRPGFSAKRVMKRVYPNYFKP